MRVALVIHHVRPGGGQDRYALELARRLAARCEVGIVAIRTEGDLPPSVRVHTVRAPSRPALLSAPLFRRAARAVIEGGRFDLVHAIGGALPGAHVITAQFCNAAWRAAAPSLGPYQRAVLAQAVADELRTYRHPALRAVIAVSRRTAAEIEHHYGPLRVPVTIIPNAVDSGLFHPASPGAPRDGLPRLLFVGAYERKGLDVAIRALARMATRAELLAVGSGDRRALAALAAALGVRDRVHLEPPRRDIADVYRSADVFVFPTRYEPFGMVIAEALASGLPVVTSTVAGAAELIRDGESGYVVADAEDADGFARAVDRLVTLDAAARGRMAAAAREAVRTLTWDSVAERTLEVYERAHGSTA